MTHSGLVEIAARWLSSTCGCGVVLKEPVCYSHTNEIPDAIGFTHAQNRTILVECKTSRKDFLRDKKKWFRRNPEFGLGSWRIYLISDHFVEEEDVPEGWSVYIVKGKQVRHLYGPKWANAKKPPFTGYIPTERSLLYSALRKAVKNGEVSI